MDFNKNDNRVGIYDLFILGYDPHPLLSLIPPPHPPFHKNHKVIQ
jgi:hypothetical protein